ncbi:hypothetical protein B0H13DRAFT_1932800 [Mycena leptocephala]|nr:hypothetical protein B0H13DRAFT_1932800 [Mycena leptocephala]
MGTPGPSQEYPASMHGKAWQPPKPPQFTTQVQKGGGKIQRRFKATHSSDHSCDKREEESEKINTAFKGLLDPVGKLSLGVYRIVFANSYGAGPTAPTISAPAPAIVPMATNSIPAAMLSAGPASTSTITGSPMPTTLPALGSTTIQNTIYDSIPTSARAWACTSLLHPYRTLQLHHSGLVFVSAIWFLPISFPSLSFSEFGNYRESTPPKRPLEAMIGSGFPSGWRKTLGNVAVG